MLVEIYDISNPEEPSIVSSYSQSGRYSSSYLSEGILYLATNYSYLMPATSEDLGSYVPSYSVDDEQFYLDASDIFVPKRIDGDSYAILGGLDVTADDDPLVSTKAVIGYTGSVYATEDNIYVAGSSG